MSASTTPDRAMSPSRARAPDAEMDALRRKLAEQKALNEAAARDVQRSERASTARVSRVASARDARDAKRDRWIGRRDARVRVERTIDRVVARETREGDGGVGDARGDVAALTRAARASSVRTRWRRWKTRRRRWMRVGRR